MSQDLLELEAWRDLAFFRTKWPDISARIDADTRVILPPARCRFRALERCQPDDTRVVILGQDPYPTPGHANGLAFSVAPDVPLPASLRNIFKEMQSDLGQMPGNGDLVHWADQGVLLLNTALSVPAGEAGGHARIGWNALVAEVLTRLDTRPRAFLMWGKHAQGFRAGLTHTGHAILTSPHPSPLSAHRGFFGSRPFSRINKWLLSQEKAPIDWVGAA